MWFFLCRRSVLRSDNGDRWPITMNLQGTQTKSCFQNDSLEKEKFLHFSHKNWHKRRLSSVCKSEFRVIQYTRSTCARKLNAVQDCGGMRRVLCATQALNDLFSYILIRISSWFSFGNFDCRAVFSSPAYKWAKFSWRLQVHSSEWSDRRFFGAHLRHSARILAPICLLNAFCANPQCWEFNDQTHGQSNLISFFRRMHLLEFFCRSSLQTLLLRTSNLAQVASADEPSGERLELRRVRRLVIIWLKLEEHQRIFRWFG